MLLLLGNPACSWHGPGPREGSARQVFAPHGAGERLCPRLVAPWVWGDKLGRCWTNSAQERGGGGRGATFVLAKHRRGATLRTAQGAPKAPAGREGAWGWGPPYGGRQRAPHTPLHPLHGPGSRCPLTTPLWSPLCALSADPSILRVLPAGQNPCTPPETLQPLSPGGGQSPWGQPSLS